VKDAVRFRTEGRQAAKTVRCCRAKWDAYPCRNVGEIYDYTEYAYRLCYLRGPEGRIIELVEKITSGEAG
jgi:hypothetical protein